MSMDSTPIHAGGANFHDRFDETMALAQPADKRPSGHALTGQPPLQPVRRRNRMIMSCLECRRRKVRCDKLQPCTNCTRLTRSCLYLASPLDSISRQRLNEINDKLGPLEHVPDQITAPGVARLRYNDTYPRSSSTNALPGESNAGDEVPEDEIPEDEKDLEPTPLVAVDASYGNDSDETMLDLGIKVGRMRMTERLGGLFRPRISEELTSSLANDGADQRTQQERLSDPPTLPDEGADFLAPGSTYISPGMGFIFGAAGNGITQPLLDFLPTKAAASLLVRNYYDNVHFIARVVHWPTFQLQYDTFWTNVNAGLEPPGWQQSVVLSVLFASIASMPEENVASVFAKPKATILGNFQLATEVALSKAQFLRLTRIETLQALVIYLIPMCRDQISRAHSALVGMAVRLAECMGLHKDSENVDGVSAIECHVQRIVWFQLSFLDFRTCESQGPRPGIKQEDYTTKIPLNIDDMELMRPSVKEAKTWTDMTCCKIRFECIEMQKAIWWDRIRLGEGKLTITQCLRKIESFRKAMEIKYTPILDITKPLQKYGRYMMTLLTQRMYVMILHLYLQNYQQKIPDRMREITLNSGTLTMESAVALETTPELAKWKWYNGAYQQWHIAFLLLSEVRIFPHRRQADRIWAILDFVFEADPSWSRAQRAWTIVEAIRDRTGIYQEMRRIRAPVKTEEALMTYNDRKDGGAPEDLRRQSASESSSIVDVGGVYGGSGGPYTRFNQALQQPQLQQSSAQQGIRTTSISPGHHSDNTHVVSSSSVSPLWTAPSFNGDDQVQWHTLSSLATQLPPGTRVSTAATADSSNGDDEYNFGPMHPSAQDTLAHNIPENKATSSQQDSLMLDINWAEWDQLFPPNINTGLLDNTDDLALPQWPEMFT